MSQEIKITAQPKDNSSCSFVVDRPVYPNGSVYFGDASRAKGSPLAEQIFAIAGVESLLVQDDVVTVNAETGGNWMPIAKQVGVAIRSVMASDESPIAADVAESIPEPEEVRRLVQDVLATIYRHLGVDTSRKYIDLAGRPHPVLPCGSPIDELF